MMIIKEMHAVYMEFEMYSLHREAALIPKMKLLINKRILLKSSLQTRTILGLQNI